MFKRSLRTFGVVILLFIGTYDLYRPALMQTHAGDSRIAESLNR